MVLLTGDAMYVFVYERRLTALRVQAGFKGQMRRTAAGVYQRGNRWRDLTSRQQLQTLTGLFHYKSVYAVIALSYLPAWWFLAGLVALALYKHWKWILLVRDTLDLSARLSTEAAAAAQPPATRPSAAEPLAH
jgi:hypothetical protein